MTSGQDGLSIAGHSGGRTTEGLGELDRARVQRRTLRVVVVSQLFGGAGLASGITVGSLLAQDVLGSDALAGVPIALFTFGSALTAYIVGRTTHRWGRRTGLGLGFAAGGLGAVGVVIGAVTGNIALLFASLFVYGAGSATTLQARYAGTDLALPERRGAAVSVAMVSTTLGAVGGPILIEPLGRLATSLGIPALAGPFMLAAVAYLAAGCVLVVMLRPDPYLLARALDASAAEASGTPNRVSRVRVGVYVGATVMVLTMTAMVAVMTMTPVHMRAHEHGLGAVGLVISLHVAAMFLPSPLTGILVDRVGRTRMAVAAGVTLLAAGLVAALSPPDSLGFLILALILLGLGWNFGLISGTALVIEATDKENRARVQGSIDVLIALAGAGGGVMSGVVMAATDYAFLSLLGGFLALLLVPVLYWATLHRDR
ncbi:MFS transporter [Tessaracoccus sp. Z1128]